MAKAKVISITNLLVNTENYRFDSVSNQKEAIDKMLDNQGDNLFNLAEHIIKHGLNPNDKIQVLPSQHDKGKYIVLEGNRRIITLKVLSHPDLIDSSKHANLKKKFKKLHDTNKSNLITEVESIVYDDPKEADVWIGIKHGYGKSGTGTDGWDPLQKQRFGEKTEGKTSTSIQIIKLLKNSSDVADDIKDKIENISTTNLDRLVDDPDVRSMLCIDVSNGVLQSSIDPKEVIKGLTQVVKDILDPKFTVKKIYDKEARKDYIKSFPKANKPNPALKASQTWQFNSPVSANPPTTTPPKPKPNPKDRNKIIPKSCVLKISNSKVNAIYHELQSLDAVKFTNAAAVLIRVFVELSVDTYLEEHKLAMTVSASKSGMNLQQKVNIVANHLESKKFADAAICKGIKNAIKEANDILGIDTWHAYIHNNKFSPKANNLVITWDNMEKFIVILWTNIK